MQRQDSIRSSQMQQKSFQSKSSDSREQINNNSNSQKYTESKFKINARKSELKEVASYSPLKHENQVQQINSQTPLTSNDGQFNFAAVDPNNLSQQQDSQTSISKLQQEYQQNQQFQDALRRKTISTLPYQHQHPQSRDSSQTLILNLQQTSPQPQNPSGQYALGTPMAARNGSSAFLPHLHHPNISSTSMMLGANGQFNDDIFDSSPYWFAFETRIRKMVLSMIEPFVKRSIQGKESIGKMEKIQDQMERKLDECEIIISKTTRHNQKGDNHSLAIEQNEQIHRVRDVKMKDELDRLSAIVMSLDRKFDIMDQERKTFATSFENFNKLFNSQKLEISQFTDQIMNSVSESKQEMKNAWILTQSKIDSFEVTVSQQNQKIQQISENFNKLSSEQFKLDNFIYKLDAKINLVEMGKLNTKDFDNRILTIVREQEMLGKNIHRIEKSQEDTDCYLTRFLPIYSQQNIDQVFKYAFDQNPEVLLKHNIFMKEKYQALLKCTDLAMKIEFDKKSYPKIDFMEIELDIQKLEEQCLQMQKQQTLISQQSSSPFNSKMLSPAHRHVNYQKQKQGMSDQFPQQYQNILQPHISQQDDAVISKLGLKFKKSKPIKQITMNTLALYHQNTTGQEPSIIGSESPNNKRFKKIGKKPSSSLSRQVEIKRTGDLTNRNQSSTNNQLVIAENIVVPVNYRKKLYQQNVNSFNRSGIIRDSAHDGQNLKNEQTLKVDSSGSTLNQDKMQKDIEKQKTDNSIRLNLVNVEGTSNSQFSMNQGGDNTMSNLNKQELQRLQLLQSKHGSNFTLGFQQNQRPGGNSGSVVDIYSQHEPSDEENENKLNPTTPIQQQQYIDGNYGNEDEEVSESQEEDDEDENNPQFMFSQSIMEKLSKPHVYESELEPKLLEKLKMFEDSIISLNERFPQQSDYKSIETKLDLFDQKIKESHLEFLKIKTNQITESQYLQKEVETITHIVDAQEKKIQRRQIEIDNIIQGFRFQIDNFQSFIDKMQNKDDTVAQTLKALIEIGEIDSMLQNSDESDKNSISLLGVKEEQLTNPKPQSFYNPQVQSTLKQNQNQTIQLDKTCLTCSSQSYKLISAFKMACLSYFPSNVIFQDKEFSRLELINVKKQLLKTLNLKLDKSLNDKQLQANDLSSKNHLGRQSSLLLEDQTRDIQQKLNPKLNLQNFTSLSNNLIVSKTTMNQTQRESFLGSNELNDQSLKNININESESKTLLTSRRGRSVKKIQDKTDMLRIQSSFESETIPNLKILHE